MSCETLSEEESRKDVPLVIKVKVFNNAMFVCIMNLFGELVLEMFILPFFVSSNLLSHCRSLVLSYMSFYTLSFFS